MANQPESEKSPSGEIPAKVAATDAVGQWLSPRMNCDWLFGLILLLAVVLVYQPAWHAGFIWDDDQHITANPCIVGPLGLKEIWTTSSARICPLVLTTFWIEHALWGLNPLPYHLVNVLLHGAGAVALWRVLRSLRVPGAWLGAALWALHPVQVETVAWITELKNTQSCLFYLLSILFFARWLKARDGNGRTGSDRYYGLTLLFAAMAMASKSSTVVLPVVLCLCAWWVEGRWQWRNVVRVTPIFLMSVAASAVSMWTQNLEGANEAQWVRSWPERVATSGDVVWFYLGKLLWPHPLIFIYPRWEIDPGRVISYLPLLALIVVAVVLWLNRETWSRPWFFALAYFVAALLPVLGLVDHYFLRYSFVGDHFQYLASMGPLALAGAGLARLADHVIPQKLWLQSSLCAGLLLVLGLLSWQRVWVYKSVETLWADTLAQNPNCWIAHTNLGVALFRKGQVDEAMDHYQKSLELDPDVAETRYNFGLALGSKGRVEEAITEYQQAVRINPNFADAHNNLGLALVSKGRVDEAITEYQNAEASNPNIVEVHFNLGLALASKGRQDEAIIQYLDALKISPNYAAAHNNLGLALFAKGRVDEAMGHYQRALEFNSSYAEAHNNLGNALSRQGRLEAAIREFQMALEISPNLAEVHNNLGVALFQTRQTEQAIAQFREALRLAPDNSDARNNLAKVETMVRQKAARP